MQCTRCGREVRDGSSFCPSCGEPVRAAYGTDPSTQETTVLPAPPRSSPFARGSDSPQVHQPPVRPTPRPAPDAFSFQQPPAQAPHPPRPVAPRRTFAEVLAVFSSGVLGAVIAGSLGALHVLAALVTAVNDDEFSKSGFLVLGLLVVLVVLVATAALAGRARVARSQGRALDAVEAMSLGGGVLTSSYGVLLLLTAALSEGGQALDLVF